MIRVLQCVVVCCSVLLREGRDPSNNEGKSDIVKRFELLLEYFHP